MKSTLKDMDLKGKAGDTKGILERLAQDDELRETVAHAVKAGKGIYRELKGQGAPAAAEKLARDKKVRKHLGDLIDDSKTARERVQGKSSHKLRTLVLLGVLAGAVYALKDQLKELLEGDVGSSGPSADYRSSNNGSGS